MSILRNIVSDDSDKGLVIQRDACVDREVDYTTGVIESLLGPREG